MTSWAGLIELGLFLSLGAVVLWVFFAPVKQDKQGEEKHDK